jgi:deazaflavin-dependent oxidoreductase (nitroreductase family)
MTASGSTASIDAESKLGYLETTGRVSGKPRETEIWFAADDRRIYLLSGGGIDKDWIRSFQRTPRVRFRVGATWVTGIARLVSDAADDLELTTRKAVAAKYLDYDPTGWPRTATPVVIDLD